MSVSHYRFMYVLYIAFALNTISKFLNSKSTLASLLSPIFRQMQTVSFGYRNKYQFSSDNHEACYHAVTEIKTYQDNIKRITAVFIERLR
jgi:hypothetical protein